MRVRGAGILIAILLVLVGATPAALAADTSAVLTASDAPGMKGSGGGRGAAIAALPGKPPKVLRRGKAAGSRAAGGGRTVTSGVFTLGSARRAKAALRSTRRGFKRLKGVGDEAYKRTSSKKNKTTAVVLLRRGKVLGAVKVVLRGRKSAAAGTAAQL